MWFCLLSLEFKDFNINQDTTKFKVNEVTRIKEKLTNDSINIEMLKSSFKNFGNGSTIQSRSSSIDSVLYQGLL